MTTTNDPGRTRTCNPRLRRPMPYPLGHGALAKVSTLLDDRKLLNLNARGHRITPGIDAPPPLTQVCVNDAFLKFPASRMHEHMN